MGKHNNEFNPYENNGGTTVAVAGRDYVVVAADTRISRDYSILSRDVSKLHQVNDNIVLATCGMQADADYLRRFLTMRRRSYMHECGKDLSVAAFTRLLSNTLYYKRFFPYYTFNLVAGLEDGRGVVFTYDSVGSTEAVQWGALGEAQSLVMPALDAVLKNRVGWARRGNAEICEIPPADTPNAAPLDVEEAVALVKDVFAGAVDRNIHCGDTLELIVMQAGNAPRLERFPLRKD